MGQSLCSLRGFWFISTIFLSAINTFGAVLLARSSPDENLYLYKKVPDIRLSCMTANGKWSGKMSNLWNQKGVLLTLVYSRCGGVCSPFLKSLYENAAKEGGLGKNYFILVMSFDPGDHLSDMMEQARTSRISISPGWFECTGKPADVKKIAAGIGFTYKKSNLSGQYDHPAMLAGIVRGKIVRFLGNYPIQPLRFQEVARELEGKFVPAYPLPGRALFSCFKYNPETGSVKFGIGFFMLLVPAATTSFIVFFLFGPLKQN